MFVSLANNVNSENNEFKTEIASENLDKGESILEAPPKVEKKETRNPRTKKVHNKKSQQKKLHFCHHYGALGHTHPNCYKWLTTQQCNSMLSFGNQNQFPSSFAPLGDLLKALMFLLNLNDLILPLHLLIKGLHKGNVLPNCGRTKAQSDSVTFSLSPPYGYALLVCFSFLF